jgi:hypothetical protein
VTTRFDEDATIEDVVVACANALKIAEAEAKKLAEEETPGGSISDISTKIDALLAMSSSSTASSSSDAADERLRALCLRFVESSSSSATVASNDDGAFAFAVSPRGTRAAYADDRAKARSMSHWFPYDPVGVVNADP